MREIMVEQFLAKLATPSDNHPTIPEDGGMKALAEADRIMDKLFPKGSTIDRSITGDRAWDRFRDDLAAALIETGTSYNHPVGVNRSRLLHALDSACDNAHHYIRTMPMKDTAALLRRARDFIATHPVPSVATVTDDMIDRLCVAAFGEDEWKHMLASFDPAEFVIERMRAALEAALSPAPSSPPSPARGPASSSLPAKSPE